MIDIHKPIKDIILDMAIDNGLATDRYHHIIVNYFDNTKKGNVCNLILK